MKKLLHACAAVAMATSSFAAVEVGFLDSEALDLGSKPTLADMTQLAATENVTLYFPYGQEVSSQNPAFNGIKTLVVNGEEIAIVTGIGGTANGVCNLDDGPSAGGCMYQFNVKKDGWLVVPSKISSNKNFYVYEGLVGNDPSAVAYTLGMDLQSADYSEIPEIKYSLPGDEFGYINREAADIDKYTFGGNTIAWPIRIATGNAEAVSGGNGTGAIVFPVYADAENYLVFATGSKMNTCGFVFVDSDPAGAAPSVSLKGKVGSDDAKTEKTIVVCGDGTSVESVAVEAGENAPVYNMMGVRVNADAKGILIQNGKKFIRK